MPIERKCKNCLCWKLEEDDGVCRARAPGSQVVVMFDEDRGKKKELSLVLPRTKKNDGCYHDFVSAEVPVDPIL